MSIYLSCKNGSVGGGGTKNKRSNILAFLQRFLHGKYNDHKLIDLIFKNIMPCTIKMLNDKESVDQVLNGVFSWDLIKIQNANCAMEWVNR